MITFWILYFIAVAFNWIHFYRVRYSTYEVMLGHPVLVPVLILVMIFTPLLNLIGTLMLIFNILTT